MGQAGGPHREGTLTGNKRPCWESERIPGWKGRLRDRKLSREPGGAPFESRHRELMQGKTTGHLCMDHGPALYSTCRKVHPLLLLRGPLSHGFSQRGSRNKGGVNGTKDCERP